MDSLNTILTDYADLIYNYYDNEHQHSVWYTMFYNGGIIEKDRNSWVKQNYETFLNGTPNKILCSRWFPSGYGYITAMEYTPCGSYIIVGHSTGLLQVHHGHTGVALCTLRSVQFPPKPIYAIVFSQVENSVCYAACMDGAVYRIVIPETPTTSSKLIDGITADQDLDCVYPQFSSGPEYSLAASPCMVQRSPVLSIGITADSTKLITGYADTTLKLFDMETQKLIQTYKVHKLRLQFIPKKLQRMHFGQVCALKCHDDTPTLFASAAWDKTLRIWDTRCEVGCTMTFEGVDVCSNSIDLKRDYCVAGSWQQSEALTLWDLTAKKQLSIIRVQNRRPDVDGEYIYACRFWNSKMYNRKAKYGIIGGSGTSCVEVINLHNRYITCSYPADGTILAITSHDDLIAYGGTASVFNIVSFHDPKHELYPKESELYWKAKSNIYMSDRDENESFISTS